MKIIIKKISVLFILIILNACAISPPKQSATASIFTDTLNSSVQQNHQLKQQADTPVPEHVIHALIPTINATVPKHEKNHHYLNVIVNNAPAVMFFTSLGKDTSYDMVISPKVSGNISLDLKHVTVPQVLSILENTYGYQYEKTTYGYNIYPIQLQTKIFDLSYLNINRSGTSKTSISSGQITNEMTNNRTNNFAESNTIKSSTIDTKTTDDFWDKLANILNTIIGIKSARNSNDHTNTSTDTPSITINPQTGLIVVTASPYQLRQVSDYLKRTQTIINREVIIDAKILEVTLNAGYQSGINWKALGLEQTGVTALNSSLQAFTTVFSVNASQGKFSTLIHLLQGQGQVNVISSPRITTMNNQKALIKVGTDQFFVTNVSSTRDISTANNQTISENIDLTPFFSGVALDVTPEIDPNNDISLHIHPIVSSVEETDLKFTLNNESNSLPSATSSIRESDNIVRAKNGQTIVIGGLMINSHQQEKGGTPVLSRLPGLGWFFQNHQNLAKKSEIVILLQPIIVNDKTMNEQLDKSAEDYQNMTQDFQFKTVFHHSLKY
ncbi:MAG: secretin N-terminal domain-containing protein [Pseudomonadota bacterium]